MKTKNLLIIFLLIGNYISAQEGFKAGLRFGMDASQVDGDNLGGYDKAGLIVGGLVSRELSKSFAAQMEIIYIQKGSRKPVDENNEYYVMRLGYIEVPVLLVWHAIKKFDATGGFAFGTLISSEEETQLGTLPVDYPFEKFELSYNLGFVYHISDNWAFDGRYCNSLTTIRGFPGYYSTYFEKGQFNFLIAMTLIYKF